MEHKLSTGLIMGTDDAGIVEAIWSVFGVLDGGGDIVQPGAFAKTFVERGGKVKVLDQHNAQSVLNVIGRPVAMRELARYELPPALLAQYPEATGGAWAKVQFLLNTPEGAGAFERIKAGAVDEWSFGYDALDKDYSEVKGPDGQPVMARNLRTIKLYELSPVIWGMNEATMTTSAKDATPGEAKPWGVIHEGAEWVIYKLDAAGERTGEALYRHATEEEAQAQLRALYASEDGLNNTGDGTSVALAAADPVPEEKAGRRLNAAKLEALQTRIAGIREHLAGIEDEVGKWASYEDEIQTMDVGSNPAPYSTVKAAGPATPPTDAELLTVIELLRMQLEA